ncbi:MAG: histidinol phosphate phosphatase [Chloroflexi bacterium]|nr:histidinol phosphate phosphatase [Chloroflexota bacterium]
MTQDSPGRNTLLEFALDAVWQAGHITLGYFQTALDAHRKTDNTPVTIADQKAEQKLRQMIAEYWPGHGILGEEFGQSPSNSPYTWIIDPIDGTKSFISGVPLYSNLLALTDGERTLIGVAHFPALGETIYAMRGQGCYWNGRRAHVSAVDSLADAVLLTSGLNYFGKKAPAWQRLVDSTYTQRTWGDAFGYFLVATGRAEVMVDPAMYIWDSAPFQVILEEAGGTFTDWRGTSTIHAYESVATNKILFDQVMSVINET